MNKTKSTKTIITTIAVMAMMISIGMMVTTQNASAMTNVERYQEGITTAAQFSNFAYTHGSTPKKDVKLEDSLLSAMDSSNFQTHTDAYRNGYISELDSAYGLKLPYVEYHSDSDGNAIVIPHYMGISISNH